MNEKLIVIDFTEAGSLDALLQLKKEIEAADYIAYDTETTGVDIDAEVIGYSLSHEVNVGYYVVLAYWDVKDQILKRCEAPFKEEALNVLRILATKNTVMHNAVFDVKQTKANFGIDLLPSVHTDTMVLAHLIDENKRVGLKEQGALIFGQDATKEQELMKASIVENGGSATKKTYELYKADKKLIGLYAAKDAVLTLGLFYHYVPQLLDKKLDAFFWDEECMPLLKSATYELNSVGLKIDANKVKELEQQLIEENIKLKSSIMLEIKDFIKDKYPATTEKNTFNINSSSQLSWLLFIVLKEPFRSLTDKGKEVCKDLLGKLPYTFAEKRRFIEACQKAEFAPEKLIKCDKTGLSEHKEKYKWVADLLLYKKNEKLLSTYVNALKTLPRYGVIYPSFLQTGTRGTRFSSKAPNFQNLPRDDKRVKSCIVARPGRAFVGADYSQLEPRIFTDISNDPSLILAYKNKEDFYSALAISVFDVEGASANKKDPNYLGEIRPDLRQVGKEIALSIAYGTTAPKLMETLYIKARIAKTMDECQDIIDKYLMSLSGVANFINSTHQQVVESGAVYNEFGRPRHIPEAKLLKNLYNSVGASKLTYSDRTFLNLAVNYRVQGTAGSIVNRACIAFCSRAKSQNLDAKVVMQVHDEIIVECAEKDIDSVKVLLKDCMENTFKLKNVDLIAEPKVAYNIGDLK